MNLNEVNLPFSIELIVLFILGFPGRMSKNELSSPEYMPQITNAFEDNTARTADDNSGILLESYQFIPGFSPQDIKIGIQIFEEEGREEKNVSIELISGASVSEFRWEDWINSAMGFIKGMHDTLISEERDAGKVPCRYQDCSIRNERVVARFRKSEWI